MNLRKLTAALASIAVMGTANASLFDRGSGMIYDDVLNITWLQDANYAKTSGHDADGRMTWTEANSWAAGLVFGGYNDWRLAKNSPVGSSWDNGFSYDGSTDIGVNITSPKSEISYMYYANLGLKGSYSTSGNIQYGIFGLNGTGMDEGPIDIGPFVNVQSHAYWLGTLLQSSDIYAYAFFTDNGSQMYSKTDLTHSAWAVRDGDVAVSSVPAPPTFLLMLTGLGMLGLTKRFRKVT